MTLIYRLAFVSALCCLVHTTALAQQADTALMNRWYDTMSSFMDSAPDDALRYVHKGIAYAHRFGNTEWEGWFTQSGGIIHDLANRMDSGIAYYKKTVALARQRNDTVMEANALGNMGAAYHARGYLEPALTYHLAAARLRWYLPNKFYLAKSYNNIGLLYRLLKQYDKALSYFTQSLQHKEAVEDTLGKVATYVNMSSCFYHKTNYDSALQYASKALYLAKGLHNVTKTAVAQSFIGLALLEEGQLAAARSHLDTANSLAPTAGYDEEMITIYQGMARYYELMQNPNEAIAWIQKGLDKAREEQRKESVIWFGKKKATLLAQQQRYNEAFAALQAASVAQDSLLSAATLRQLNEMNIAWETETREAQIAQLSTTAELTSERLVQSNWEKQMLLVVLVMFVAITAITVLALRNNRIKNKQLLLQKKIIEQQLSDKEVLMQEIHHRVKNNLQIISGLLNLQSRHIADPNAQQAVREGKNRVKSIALIHQQLYQQENLTEINLKHYVQELMQSVHQSFRQSGQHVHHQINCPDVMMDVEVAVPIGLILNELATNSYKYAFAEGENGTITWQITQNGKALNMQLFDNGVGLPQGFDWQKQKSFGMKMIATLAAKLKATISWQNDNGTQVTIYIPDYTNIA